MTPKSTNQPPESTVTDDVAGERDKPVEGTPFPIVGVGASAGGLEALTQLLKALPADTGMAFVLVQHLAPSHPSALADILSRATKMPVAEVCDDWTIEPNHVYVIPPDRAMIIVRGALQLLPRESQGIHHPIDQFLRSLAEEHRHRAIGVVLSGTATDGTIGLEEIKAEGGITFAQDSTAQHGGMPHSAVASGCVDFVLPPDGIAREIVRIGQHPYAVPGVQDPETEDMPKLAQVLQLLHHSTGADFTGYKFNTLYRRVTRRMVFQKMHQLAEYVAYLRKTPAEADALYQDLLISVTSFFRDTESFEAIKNKVFTRLLKDRSRRDAVRLWALGCSTGQEAYSLAIAFTEAAEAADSPVPLQIFATDLNATSIEKARAGVYAKDISQDVSPERLRRFFTEVDGQYRVSKAIRDACIFSRHNVLTDPPFSRIDLISCRNLLIYLDPVLQQRVIPTLHYALKPAGWLWLGRSETIGAYRNLFDAEDAKHKIYTKKSASDPGRDRFPMQHGGAPRAPFVPITARLSDAADLPQEADRVLLTKFVPPGVLVSADLNILQYRGDTSPYLSPAPGKASLSLLKMLREGLLVPVRAAVVRAGKQGAPAREEGVRVKSHDGYLEIAVEVIPLKGHGATNDGGFLVLFEDAGSASGSAAASRALEPHETDTDKARIQQELSATREYLQSVIEQQEAANEELQSANEEIQSANEELQSMNEELETSKEEIQSSNEELAIVNDELNNRNVELHRVNDDLVNLLGSVQLPIVILGPDLRVRRFTPMAQKLFNLNPTDVGRPLANIKIHLENLDDLEPLLTEVIDTVSAREREVQDNHGRWYSLRLHPYKTLENKIDGVVAVLVDVDSIKRAEEATAHLGAIVTSCDDAIISTSPRGIIRSWNEGAQRMFGYTAEEAIGKPATLLIPVGHADQETGIMGPIMRGEAVAQIETVRQRKDGSLLDVSLTVSPVRDSAGRIIGAAKIARDITARIQAEKALRESRARFETIFDTSPVGMYLVDAQLRIRQLSQQARAVFGDIGELIGKDLDDVLHIVWAPEIADELVVHFRHTLESGEPYAAAEFSAKRRDRNVRECYDLQLHRISLPEGQCGVVCYFIDISERIRLTDELRRHAAVLSESDRRKDEFLAMLSHELRNPLAPIMNSAQLLQLQPDQSALQRQASTIIERQVGQLDRLVNDLLEVSRISTGGIRLQREQLDLRVTANSALETVRPLIERNRHELVVRLPPSPIWIDGDPTRLEQVIVNLLNNAAKYTDNGGQIWLTLQQEQDEAVLQVRDSGVGIAPELLPHVFDWFTQAKQSLARSHGGLGIGLSLVQQLVSLHGGKVTVSSTLKQGSEFVVRLPALLRAEPPLPPPPSEKDKTAVPSLRVLVVDDIVDTATSMAMLLRASGHDVREAPDGPTAIKAALDFRPDVALLDLGLPGLDGFELAKQMRQQPSLKEVVLVATTGYGKQADPQRLQEAGFDHYLVKPTKFEKVQEILASVSKKAT